MKSAVNWFEIPVAQLDRAAQFYEAILQTKLKRERFGEQDLAILTAEEPGVAGALVLDPKRKPNVDGTLVYLNANGRIDSVVDRVASAGGKVLLPKTDIGQPGFIALIRDTEGNCVGLHSER
jgi:predicted enzyme related to lactoylglutathione lyase